MVQPMGPKLGQQGNGLLAKNIFVDFFIEWVFNKNSTKNMGVDR